MASRLTIGCIPYLNLFPFYHGGPLGELPYVEAPPRQLGEMAAAGRVDAAPLALVDTWRWQDELQPIADLGLACAGAVESVLLFSRRPLTELSGQVVHITSQSSTSAALLRLLLVGKHRLAGVRFAWGEGGGEAFLVIGDAALHLADDPPSAYPYVSDLGEEWTGWTGRPFVFARWVARRAIARDQVEELGDLLCRRLSHNLEDLPRLAASSRAGFSAARVEEYLRRFRYRLSDDDFEGAALFRRQVSSNGVMA